MSQSTNQRHSVIQSSTGLGSLSSYKPIGSMSQGIPLLLQAWGGKLFAQSIQQQRVTESSKVLTDLSAHLGKDVYDVDAFGTVSELINERI